MPVWVIPAIMAASAVAGAVASNAKRKKEASERRKAAAAAKADSSFEAAADIAGDSAGRMNMSAAQQAIAAAKEARGSAEVQQRRDVASPFDPSEMRTDRRPTDWQNQLTDAPSPRGLARDEYDSLMANRGKPLAAPAQAPPPPPPTAGPARAEDIEEDTVPEVDPDPLGMAETAAAVEALDEERKRRGY